MCVQRLEEGEIASWTGTLHSDRQAAELAIRADPAYLQQRIDEAVRTAQQVADANLTLEKRKHEVDEAALIEQALVTENDLKRQLTAASPSWYERPLFVIPVTIVVTLGAVFGAATLVDKLAR